MGCMFDTPKIELCQFTTDEYPTNGLKIPVNQLAAYPQPLFLLTILTANKKQKVLLVSLLCETLQIHTTYALSLQRKFCHLFIPLSATLLHMVNPNTMWGFHWPLEELSFGQEGTTELLMVAGQMKCKYYQFIQLFFNGSWGQKRLCRSLFLIFQTFLFLALFCRKK